MSILWDQAAMGTGFPEIDRQHKELIRRLDGFIEAMKNGRSREEITQLVTFLASYASSHFAHEEACMNRLRCPVAAKNQSAHRHFITVFEEIAAELKADGPKVSLALRAQRELADWVREHIVRVDTNLRTCAPAAS